MLDRLFFFPFRSVGFGRFRLGIDEFFLQNHKLSHSFATIEGTLRLVLEGAKMVSLIIQLLCNNA